MEEGVDFVVCQICERHLKSLGVGGHLKSAHNITTSQYRTKYPGATVDSETYRLNQSQAMNMVVRDESWRQEVSRRITRNWERGIYKDKYTDEVRRKMSNSAKAAWARGSYDNVFSITGPEKLVEYMLQLLKFPYTFQHRIVANLKTYIVDFLVGEFLVIEVFGNYWHTLPGAPENDKERLNWLETHGYNTLVLWESDINENPISCMEAIKDHLREPISENKRN